MRWRESEPAAVLRPERSWESADEVLATSLRSSVDRPANQLRDSFIFLEGEALFLVYVVAGESALGIARLRE